MTDEATASELAQRGRRRLTAVIITVGVLVAGAIVAVVVTTSDGAQPSRYSSLPRSCGLLRAATLAAYTPDATWSTAAVTPVPGAKQYDACVWTSGGQPARMIFVGVALFTSAAKAQRTSASDLQQFRTTVDTGSTFLTVTVFPEDGSDGSVPIPGAQNSYDSDLQFAEKPFTADSMTTTPTGTRPVTGLGQQATAVFQKETGNLIGTMYGIELVLWSGNAEIQLSVQSLATTTRAQPAQLAAGVAIARSVLAALPRAKR